MGYIPGFDYDIFISYAHTDNISVEDEEGWVEQFYKILRVALWQAIGTEEVKIWWDDKRIDGGVVFDDAIANGLKKSAILLCLNSPSFLNSPYCKKELKLFYDTAKYDSIGLRTEQRSRIFNVLLNNISYSQWPVELAGTDGFNFHDVKQEEENEGDEGHKLDQETPAFKENLNELCDSLSKLIKILAHRHKPPPEFSIYFGDVTETLSKVKKLAINELEKAGFNVVTGFPPPDDGASHEATVKEKIIESSLSVHLLNQHSGREIEGEDTMWYPKKQVEIGLRYARQQLIWVPKEMDINLMEESKYKTFMQELDSGKKDSLHKIEYIKGSKGELPQQIKDLAEELKKQLVQPAPGKLSVLLDTHYNDQMYAFELSKSLLSNQIQPFINPQDDDPRNNINILEDRISQVNKLVFFYGNVAADWVAERMKAARQLIVSNQYPVKDFFVLMLPPHKDPNDKIVVQQFKVSVVNNSDQILLDTNALELLLKSLKEAA